MLGDKSNCLISDDATDKDTLGFKPYVEAIAEFLTDKETLAPITLSIDGPWGCGKSSFMKQLKKSIEQRDISQVNIWVFLSCLFLKSKQKNYEELILQTNIWEKLLVENFYSLTNKFCSIILYIDSKIRKIYFNIKKEGKIGKSSSNNSPEGNKISGELSEVKIWVFIKYLFLR